MTKAKSYVCMRCQFEFKYLRMVEYCPNCGTRGFMQLQKGFNMDKEKALKLIRTLRNHFNDTTGLYDDLSEQLFELAKWVDYKTK